MKLQSLHQLFLVITLFVLGSGRLHAQDLLYTGLTESGWQIFQKSLETGDELQLTHSVGDKRSPVYSEALTGVVYRGPRGKIWKVNKEGEESLLVDLEGCADFSLDGQDIYFTRFATDNMRRLKVWKAEGEFPTKKMKLVYFHKDGSICQIQYRDGKFLGTHLWKRGEELIVIIDPENEPHYRVISEREKVSAFPRWVSDTEIVYSYCQDQQIYYLVSHQLSSNGTPQPGSMKRLTKHEGLSELGVSYSGADHYYFEQLNNEGVWSLASFNQKTGKVDLLDIARPARDPFILK